MTLEDFQIPSMPGAVPNQPPSGQMMSAPFPSSQPPVGGMASMGGGMSFGSPSPSLPPPPAPSGPPPVSSPMGGIAMPSPQPIDPASMQYDTETQADGTVLLRVKSPDGSRGPVIQIISPKQPKAPSVGR